MAKATAQLPTPAITEGEDGTWTLEVPGLFSSAGHPAPEWAMARGVEAARKSAGDAVRRWIAGTPVTDAEKALVLLVTKGDSQVYAWLDAALVDDPAEARAKPSKRSPKRRG